MTKKEILQALDNNVERLRNQYEQARCDRFTSARQREELFIRFSEAERIRNEIRTQYDLERKYSKVGKLR